MDNNRNSYNSILKAIGLFGGVKVFDIIVNVLKNKIVAVLLGPFGMGVVGMITSTTGMISAVSSLGLHTSAVRDVTKAYSEGNDHEINEIVSVLRKLVIFTGLLGSVVLIVFAKFFSLIAFGNEDYTLWFQIVSVVLLLDQICVGQRVLMQGTFHYKYIAKATLLGSFGGLVLATPLYFVWGINAIVPVLIVSSFANLLFSILYARKIPYKKVKLTMSHLLSKGRNMIVLGIAISLTGLVNTGQTYLMRIAISFWGNIADVGLYTAGIAIANQYINVVLTSMGSDYSPRLAAISNKIEQFNEAINRQMKLLVTIIAPLLILFVVFVKQLTILLYSDKFIPIAGLLEWVMFGMFFRAISWCLSFAYVARGDAKLFLLNETITAIYSLLLCICGYVLYGFDGMGIAFSLTYVIYTIQLFFISRKRFNYRIDNSVLIVIIKLLISSFLFISLLMMMNDQTMRLFMGILFILMSLFLSYRELKKMINMKETLNSILVKFRK